MQSPVPLEIDPQVRALTASLLANCPERPLSEAVQGLLTRRSAPAKRLGWPVPEAKDLLLMAMAALRAPDHGEEVPYRFAVVDEDDRENLARLFMSAGADQDKDSAAVAADGQRAREAPMTVAVIARTQADECAPSHRERWIAIGGAITNFLNMAHALGYAGKMVSGDKAAAPAVSQAFCGVGEVLAGWIVLGTLASPITKPPRMVHPHAILSRWPSPSPAAQGGC